MWKGKQWQRPIRIQLGANNKKSLSPKGQTNAHITIVTLQWLSLMHGPDERKGFYDFFVTKHGTQSTSQRQTRTKQTNKTKRHGSQAHHPPLTAHQPPLTPPSPPPPPPPPHTRREHWPKKGRAIYHVYPAVKTLRVSGSSSDPSCIMLQFWRPQFWQLFPIFPFQKSFSSNFLKIVALYPKFSPNNPFFRPGVQRFAVLNTDTQMKVICPPGTPPTHTHTHPPHPHKSNLLSFLTLLSSSLFHTVIVSSL